MQDLQSPPIPAGRLLVLNFFICFSARYLVLRGSGRLASVGRPQMSLWLWLDVGNTISLSYWLP